MQYPHSYPRRLPPEIQAQERDIELLFRRLLKNSRDTQFQSDVAQREDVAVWILIVVQSLMSVLAFYILFMKASGN